MVIVLLSLVNELIKIFGSYVRLDKGQQKIISVVYFDEIQINIWKHHIRSVQAISGILQLVFGLSKHYQYMNNDKSAA